jgi:hypothetical protein
MPKQTPYQHWAKQQMHEDWELLECPEYDPIKDFNRDPTGYYVLIKVNFATIRIEVGICSKDHEIVKIFSGRKAQDLYYQIFQHEKKNNLRWFEDKSHIAYLGKELKKAELALVTGNSAYFQE